MLVSDLIRNSWFSVANAFRRARRVPPRWVLLPLSGVVTEREARERRPFPLSLLPWPAPLSVEELATTLRALAADPRIPGVVIRLGRLDAGPATLADLREALARVRAAGKRTVVWTPQLDSWHLYLAAACDEIVMPPSGAFEAAGLRAEVLFLKDTLARIGLTADLEALGEYEVAPDAYRRSGMTSPHREMLEWLLESLESEIVEAIGRGRGVSSPEVQAWFDAVPLSADDAMAAGIVDAVAYEDELPSRLGGQLVPWAQARRRVLRPRQWHTRGQLGIVSIEGTLVMGKSRRAPTPIPLPLPFPSQQAGAETIVSALRAAEAHRRIAAVVLHIDSPGGSALAADLIWRQVTQLQTAKPVVAWLGNQAASGGYYIAAPANWIVAQSGTLTGSIGIWGGKVVAGGLWAKIDATPEVVQRGARAGLYSSLEPFGPDERGAVRAQMAQGYARFKARVAEGRGMTDDQVEAIARGQVWTGSQALAHGLVDELGGIEAALDKARDLAGLPPDREPRVVAVGPPRRWVPPADEAEGAAAWAALWREHTWALAPWHLRIRG